MDTKKRSRCNNYTTEEELSLLLEIEKLKHIVENKQSDKIHLSKKCDAWKVISNNFNASNGSAARTVYQLKVKYENLKMRARKFAAEHKFALGTGERSPNMTITNDPVLDLLLKIVNFKTIVGMSNPFDLDSIRNNQSKENVLPPTIDLASATQEDVSDSKTIPALSNIEFSQPLSDEENDELLCPKFVQAQDVFVDPSTSQISVKSENLEDSVLDQTEEVSTSSLTSKGVVDISEKTEVVIQPTTAFNKVWKNYPPRKLKTPISNLRKNYYRKKALYLNEELKKCKLEQEEILRKRKQDEEYHERSMVLLNLEIELKERELNL